MGIKGGRRRHPSLEKLEAFEKWKLDHLTFFQRHLESLSLLRTDGMGSSLALRHAWLEHALFRNIWKIEVTSY